MSSENTKIAREVSLFMIAFAAAFLQNVLVRKRLIQVPSLAALSGKCASAGNDDAKFMECLNQQAEASRGKRGNTIGIAVRWNAMLSLFLVGIPLGAAYLAWDWSKKSKTEALVSAVTYMVLVSILHAIISSAGRATSYTEVTIYSTVFAITASGLSALMHELY